VAAAAVAWLTPGGLRAAAEEGELLDRVWAGHPVSFAFVTERGHQFVAYYDAERRITVAGRKLPDGPWQRVRPEGVPVPARKRNSNVIAWDSHNFLRLALDRDGYLHLSGNMHVDPLVYYRSERPWDVTSLRRIDRMTGDRETRCTYPVFLRTPAGELLFRYRDGSSGNGSDLYNRYDPETRTWRRLLDTALLDGEGERNAYAGEPVSGPDGRFHLVWVWRETPDCATNHSLSYARSRDLVHWENSRGEPLALPITLAKGEVVDAAPPGGGLINMTFALGFDAAQRPVVTYHRYDAAGKSQVWAARPRESGWENVPLSDWTFRWAFSGGGSIPAEVRVGPARPDREGNLTVDFSTREAGNGRWRLDGATLARLATLPPPPVSAAESRLRTRPAAPGMEVQTLASRGGGQRWLLRWETWPRNRDKPRETIPPPSELRLHALPDAETSEPVRVGS
jgi:hypothetical protein